MDFRTYVIFGEISYIMPKVSRTPESIVTNWSQKGTIELQVLGEIPRHAVEQIKKSAITAAEKMGVNYTGVDVMLSSDYDKAYVLEAQTDAGLPLRSRHDVLADLATSITKQLLKKEAQIYTRTHLDELVGVPI